MLVETSICRKEGKQQEWIEGKTVLSSKSNNPIRGWNYLQSCLEMGKRTALSSRTGRSLDTGNITNGGDLSGAVPWGWGSSRGQQMAVGCLLTVLSANEGQVPPWRGIWMADHKRPQEPDHLLWRAVLNFPMWTALRLWLRRNLPALSFWPSIHILGH